MDPAVIIALVSLVFLVVVGLRLTTDRRRARSRLEELPEEEIESVGAVPQRGLLRWLHLAGLRRPGIQGRWLLAQGLALLAGAGVVAVLSRNQAADELAVWATEVPGGFGDLALPVLGLAPWIVFLLVVSLPTMWVRALRRRRVAQIEQDLPVILELLATLGEAGLGFDAALDRVLAAQPADRPLVRELRAFQQEVLAGVPRWQSFRRLARRIDVPGVSIFVAALVQAEQVGAGLSTTLRGQAGDLWNRRRERALMTAQSLPAKLAFPLVLCFLPALFVITLGPILLDFIKLAEGVLARNV